MIINWMLYSVLSSALIVITGYAAAYAARSLRLPTRHVWAAVLVFSVALSALSLSSRLMGARATLTVVSTAESNAASPSTLDQRNAICEINSPHASVLCLPFGVDERSTGHFDTRLLLTLVGMAVIAFSAIAVAMVRLRRVTAAFERAHVLHTNVLVSRDIGPALIGVFTYTAVLPRWTLQLSESELRTILEHEQQHAQARDPALLLFALLLVALQPWNAALWIAWSQLRLATEVDCDARVIATHGDRRAYGRLLVRVYERSVYRTSPLSALVSRRSDLEKRVRRMMERNQPFSALRSMSAIVGTLMSGTLAACVDVTSKQSLTDHEATALTDVNGEANAGDGLFFFVDDAPAEPLRVARIPLDDMQLLDPSVKGNRVEIRILTDPAVADTTPRSERRRKSDSMTLFVSHYSMRFYARRHMPISRWRGDSAFVQRLD